MDQFLGGPPQFGPVPSIGGADIPSKAEQRRVLAANIAMNLVINNGIPLVSESSRTSLTPDVTAEKQFVNICKLIEKFIETSN